VHTVPHAPQLEVSLPVSTQDVPHVVLLPQSALQLPALQTVPAPQALLQLPQCFESEFSSTQRLPHRLYPALQLRPHCPPAQLATPLAAPGQAWPQVPQFWESESSF
jgi:hypothetical protein